MSRASHKNLSWNFGFLRGLVRQLFDLGLRGFNFPIRFKSYLVYFFVDHVAMNKEASLVFAFRCLCYLLGSMIKLFFEHLFVNTIDAIDSETFEQRTRIIGRPEHESHH